MGSKGKGGKEYFSEGTNKQVMTSKEKMHLILHSSTGAIVSEAISHEKKHVLCQAESLLHAE